MPVVPLDELLLELLDDELLLEVLELDDEDEDELLLDEEDEPVSLHDAADTLGPVTSR